MKQGTETSEESKDSSRSDNDISLVVDTCSGLNHVNNNRDVSVRSDSDQASRCKLKIAATKLISFKIWN